MANSVPQPNQGATAGCNCQRLQERKQASGVKSMFPSFLGQTFPTASEKWLPSALGGRPKDKLAIVFYPKGAADARLLHP